MAYKHAFYTFNAGELSPKMLARPDVDQYRKGCQTLRNFIVTPYGAAERRPGTTLLAQIAPTEIECRLIPFVVASTTAYVGVFTNLKAAFYRDGVFVTEIVTPYTSAMLSRLALVQSADVMTIVHPEVAPQELKRTGASTFTLTEKPYQHPATLDVNTDETINLTLNFTAEQIMATRIANGGTSNCSEERAKEILAETPGKSCTLTSNSATNSDGESFFTSGNVGGYFTITHSKTNRISQDINSNLSTSAIQVKGDWTLTTHGTWTGSLALERSYDKGTTWTAILTVDSANDNNAAESGTEEQDNAIYRLTMSNYSQSGSGTIRLCRAQLVNPSFERTGAVKITAITDASHATGTITTAFAGYTASTDFAEGAWSSRRGFPGAVAFYEERMWFGGTSHSPNRLWGSKTGDWDNFLLGSDADNAMDLTLASDTVNRILWFGQHDALIVGTEDSEWTLGTGDRAMALSASNLHLLRQSVYGSEPIPAVMAGNSLLFVQRLGRKVRDFSASDDYGHYQAPDLAVMADHINGAGITEVALQHLPEQILWCRLTDGTLSALSYNKEQQVVGWSRQDTTQGKIVSICVIPDGGTDRVYWATQRFGKTYLEVMDVSPGGAPYLDAKQTGTTIFPATASIRAYFDGEDLGEYTYSEIPEFPVGTVIGVPYCSTLSPMPPEDDVESGATLLRKKIIAQLKLRVYDTIGGWVKVGGDPWRQINSVTVSGDKLDEAILPKTEIINVYPRGGYEECANILIQQDDAYPLNISCLAVRIDLGAE